MYIHYNIIFNMDKIEIKEYDLRFVIDQTIRIAIGSSVALVNKPPVISDDFYWVDRIISEPFGLMYSIYGIDGLFHECELYPLLPVLVSGTEFCDGGKFYYNGKICDYVNSLSLNIIATPDMFGWLYNEGPPHDHNMRWIDSRYLEDYNESSLISIVRNNFKMSIIVDGNLLKLHDGKIIIDRYDLLRKSPLTIIN